MERNGNFVLVGVFVLISAISLLSFVFWLAKYGGDEDKYINCTTFVNESIAGLKKSSVVKIKGIDVGFVEGIFLDSNNGEQIEIRFKLEKTAPITIDSFVTLSSQGIAGVGYLDIEGGVKNQQKPQPMENGLIFIPSKPSNITLLTQKAKQISLQFETILSKSNAILSDKNIKNLEKGISNFSEFSSELKNNKGEFKKIFANSNDAIVNFNQTITKTNETLKKSDELIEETKNLASSGVEIAKEIKAINIQRFTNDTREVLQETKSVLGELKNLATESKEVVENFKNSPSDIFFKEKVIKLGPGE